MAIPRGRRIAFLKGQQPRIANTQGLELFRRYREPRLGAASTARTLSPAERQSVEQQLRKDGKI